MCFATETLALGINMPARTVVVERLEKWSGAAHELLTPGQFTQLTGRAGRRGLDARGHAVVAYQRDIDFPTVASLVGRRVDPLRSSFTPSYNMAVNLLRRQTRAEAEALLSRSFAQFQADRGAAGEEERIARNRRRSTATPSGCARSGGTSGSTGRCAGSCRGWSRRPRAAAGSGPATRCSTASRTCGPGTSSPFRAGAGAGTSPRS